MNAMQLYQEIGLVEEKLIAQANPLQFRRRNRVKWMSITAACILLIFGASIFTNPSTDIQLALSTDSITARYIEKAPTIGSSGDLQVLTEEELINKSNTIIFKGTIQSIQNIEIDLNGSKLYRAIAQISVDAVYRGNCSPGTIASVVIPCPINSEVWVEDTGVVSAMRPGMSGIFMPMVYDTSSIYSENGATLYWQDLAPYGFSDGERFAFLKTDQGLVFARDAYPSLANATTLDAVEQFIYSKQ